MKIKNLVIGIGITILMFLVVFTGIQTFYPAPQYENFCDEFRAVEITETQEQCEAIDGKWNTDRIPRQVKSEGGEPILTGFCDRDFTCREDFESENEAYSKNLFIITLVIGVILLIIGGILFELEAVGAGLMGGGIITLLYGSGTYWRYAGDAFRFAISIIGLALVIALAYWLNKKK